MVGAELQTESRSFQRGGSRDDADQGLMARLAASGLVDRGCVLMLDLEAIRVRLGDRWPYKRAQVWEAIEHHLAKRLRPEDFHAQVGETELLLAAGDTRDVNLARALNIQKELLTFFLGRQVPADLKISQVVSLEGDVLIYEPVDNAALARAVAAAAAPPAHAYRPAPQPEPARDWSAMAFVSTEGRDLELTFEFQRVISLDSFAGAATRVRPVLWERGTSAPIGPEWRRDLSFADQLNIDLATLDAAQPLYVSSPARRVVVPCSLAALASIRGRASVIGRLSHDEKASEASLIVELMGVDGGTPRGQLVEATAVLRRHCKAVIARATPDRACLQVLKDGQLSGLSVDCSGFPDDDRLLLAALWSMSKAVRPMARALFMLGLPSMGACRLAQAVGATFATVRRPLTTGVEAA